MSALQQEIQQAIRAVLSAPGGLMPWQQAAEYLGVTAIHIETLVRENPDLLPVVRHTPNGRKYIDRADLEAYIRAKKQRGGEQG